MALKIRLAIWWHMHQPCYRNSYDGALVMPLAFLHAIKDYYDMLKLSLGRDRVRTTFNMVPSLIDQIELSGKPGNDIFLQTLLKPAADLEEDELAYLFDFLFLGNVRNQIIPLRRYYGLYEKWGRHPYRKNTREIFTHAEILDLEVLFILSWIGTAIRDEEPAVRELLLKGSGFSQEEKEDLIRLLQERVAEIIGSYKEAAKSGEIEITTTPYYHPILPLLQDFSSARATQKSLPLPVVNSSLAVDASRQVERAMERYQTVFGFPCGGMWPAEGAVSMESLSIMARCGVRYAGSDEEVLANSLGMPYPEFTTQREQIYRPWNVQTADGVIRVFFRDRELSDLIGFTFQRLEASHAVGHFMAKLHDIRNNLKSDDAVVSVILDGENAWEHYPNNGREFLDRFYDALGSDESIELVTLSQASESAQNEELKRMIPGSWIGGHLSTWIGHPEKNRAWQLVCHTRDRLTKRMTDVAEDIREKVLEQILIAEGSDWYWWFGDDHFTSLADRFDELFRLHLVNAYRFAGVEAPAELLQPIRHKRARGHLRVPTDMITPVLDGRVTHYFEWINAGRFDLDLDRSTMHRSDPILRDLHYGFDADYLYLQLGTEGSFAHKAEGLTLIIDEVQPQKARFSMTVSSGKMTAVETNQDKAGLEGSVDKVAEIKIPLEDLGADPGQDILLSFTLWKDKDPLEKAPLFSLVRIPVPEDYDLEYWIV